MRKFAVVSIVFASVFVTAVATYTMMKLASRIHMSNLRENAVPLELSVNLNKRHTCSSLSPPMLIGGMPKGAVQLEISILDLNNNYDHKGGVIALSNDGAIDEGMLPNYIGPCPGINDHTYRFRANALSSDDDIIGIGEAPVRCCSNIVE